MTTPGELVADLEYEIAKAEGNDGDWKFLSDETKARYRNTALYLVLTGWSK